MQDAADVDSVTVAGGSAPYVVNLHSQITLLAGADLELAKAAVRCALFAAILSRFDLLRRPLAAT